MRPLDRLHVEVDSAGDFVLADRGITGVREGTRLSIA